MSTRRWLIGLGVASWIGCETPPPPGELVGRYAVTGAMATDTCGPGLGANRSIKFNAEIRDDEGTGYWLYSDRRPTPGTLDASGNFLFQQQGGWTLVNPSPEQGYAGCRVAQIETINGKVDRTDTDADAGVSDEDVADFTGSNSIDVVPIAGDDCSPALANQGGPLLALPCRVAYTLTGTRLEVDE